MERPKRRITSRCLEYNGGLLHEEELALRRALQASLMAAKTSTQPEKAKKNITKPAKDDLSAIKEGRDIKENQKASNKRESKSNDKQRNGKNVKRKSEDGKDTNPAKRRKKLLIQVVPRRSGKRTDKQTSTKVQKQTETLHNVKRKMKDLNKDKKVFKRKKKKHHANSDADSRTKATESMPRVVHAQRKFAQTNPGSPRSLLLFQSQKQALKTRAKTEDFLDFLCLRGTDHLPKSLEYFNSPCTSVSRLTDDEEPSKASTSPTSSKTSSNDQNGQSPQRCGGESAARCNLNMRNTDEPRSPCSSSSSSTVSPPLSTRTQPHAVLPEFTNAKTNYGVLTHIPTPIPYPPTRDTPLHPAGRQGLDIYGAPSTTSILPPGFPYHPKVSSVAMETHRPPSCSQGDKQGFYLVNSILPGLPSGATGTVTTGNFLLDSCTTPPSETTTSTKFRETSNKNLKSPNKSPAKTQDKSPNKSSNKSPKKGSARGIASSSSGKKHNDIRVPVSQGLEEVPLFTPTEQEFKQPLRYIESIKQRAEPFGICVVVPPESWEPEFCLSDDVRFTTKFQHVHRLGSKYPPVEHELSAIRKHLEQQDISLAVMPQIAGCELDLPFMSKVVREFGGLQQIIDKRKWGKVADMLKIPKTAIERTTKLEQIYCKYLLSYDLLSEDEKMKLFESVEDKPDLPESPTKSNQEYMSKGRSMALSLFQRTSKNNMEHHLKLNAGIKDVEKTYWGHVNEGQRFVVVHTAKLSNTGFPTAKGTPFSKSRWNFNVLPQVIGSAFRDLSEVEGISSPLVKAEMMFSTETWHTSPHGLFTLDYLHQGSDKIWYSVPSFLKEKFLQIACTECNGKRDMKQFMMSPLSLMEAGVPVYKVVQEPGQFIVRFPDAYHSSISSGYALSEALYFAPLSHMQRIKASFQLPAAQPKVDHKFSWECLIISSVKEELRRNISRDALSILIPELEELRSREAALRNELEKCGVERTAKKDDEEDKETSGKSRGHTSDPSEIITCDVCNRLCFLSAVSGQSGDMLCLQHALTELSQEKKQDGTMSFAFLFDMVELDKLLKEAREKLKDLQRKPKTVKRRVNVGSPGDKKVEKGHT